MPKRKRRVGDRRDGRKIRSLPPMNYVSPFIMKTRSDAQNYFKASIDYDAIETYIKEKREHGLSGFGFMHLIVAAYVRMVSQKPAIHRFIAGQRIFSRNEIVLSMMVKKEMKLNAQETAIKVRFQPTDTAEDVYHRMEEAIDIARRQGDTTNLDFVARAINIMPAVLLRLFVGLMQLLDYFGLMPKVINEASPFHCSIFVSNLGSLGIPPIYHHLYNFGNTPVFITFGAKRRELALTEEGNIYKRTVVDYTVVTDERITDGHYMASAFKSLEKLFHVPSKLDTPPEQVIEDIA